MSYRSARRRLSNQNPIHALSCELLESKQMLSGSSLVSDDTQVQTIRVVEPVPSGEYQLEIAEVHRVGQEIWVLSRLFRDGVGIQVLTSAEDSVAIDAPDLPHRHFRIGGSGEFGEGAPFPASDQLTHVDSVDEFRKHFTDQDSEQLFGRVDPELQAWRESILEKLTSAADEEYGDMYGKETERAQLHLRYIVDPIASGGFPFIALADGNDLSFSETNVQVAGVDEGDIVETDGEFIYIVSGQELSIVRAIGDDADAPHVVSRTELTYTPQAMFLHKGRLTLIGRDYANAYFHRSLGFVTGAVWRDFVSPQNRTTISVFDISDQTSPKLTQETILDGDFVTARAIGSDVFVVLNNRSGIPYLPSIRAVEDGKHDDGKTKWRYQTRDEYLRDLRRVVNKSTPPSIYRRTETGELERLGTLENSMLNSESWRGNGTLTSVLKFDTTSRDPGPVDNVSFPTGNGWSTKIYASHNAIYLMTTEYAQVEENGKFLRIDQSDVLTRISKVSTADDKMSLQATGVVRGTVDNQFSADEHDGYLRVATTTDFGLDSENHLFVLEQVDDQLTIVGSIEGLAPTESIYSMRFDGDRGWMVTFRKVDPVFSFDLSDPTNPRVTGQLKIPGYSDYLQLIDENHLLAIGRGTSDSGSPRFAWFQEVQVSLFDISDMEAPTLMHRFSFDGGRSGHSEALINHHAFNYIPEFQLLAVPFSNPENSSYAAGLITLHVDPVTGIELVGDVNQPGSVRRSVRIEDILYAVSDESVSTLNLNNPDEVLHNILLQNDAMPVLRHEELLQQMIRNAADIFLTKFEGPLGDLESIFLGVGDRPTDWADTIASLAGSRRIYEFRITNAATGDEIVTIQSTDSIASLRDFVDAETGAILDGVSSIQIEVRSRDTGLDDSVWSDWSEPRTITLAEDRPILTSPDLLPLGEAFLKWSKLADRGETDLQTFALNAVSHYEAWVTDANTRALVKHETDLKEPELDISDLGGGRKLWVWIRAAFEDGTFGDWSSGKTIRTLAEKPQLRDVIDITANLAPEFQWDDVSNAVGFEIEVTNSDGSVQVHSVDEIADSRHQLRRNLQPGRYALRVRAMLASDSFTEWSDSHVITIVGKPEVGIRNNRLTVQSDAAANDNSRERKFEVWVSRKETSQRVFHSRDWTASDLENAADAFGISDESPGDYHVWFRELLADGSESAWSERAVLQVFAEAIQVNPVSEFLAGEDQEFSWSSPQGVESFEIFIRKVGDAVATYQQAGITELTHALANRLGTGDYEWWIRGALAAGGLTRWGPRSTFSISDRPSLAITNGALTWPAITDSLGYEVWVNKVGDNGELIEARVIHDRNLVGNSISVSELDGTHRAWVRSISVQNGRTVRSAWSKPLEFAMSQDVDLARAFDDAAAGLLQILDTI